MGSPSRDSVVSLRALTAANVDAVCDLAVHPSQTRFVAANARSIALAHVSPHAWVRAIHADETPIGFVMLDLAPDAPAFLWRFMIDARYQGLGLGRRALDLVLAHVRATRADPAVETCVAQAEGGPQRFYEAAGFVLTGEYEDGQAVMRRDP